MLVKGLDKLYYSQRHNFPPVQMYKFSNQGVDFMKSASESENVYGARLEAKQCRVWRLWLGASRGGTSTALAPARRTLTQPNLG